MLQAYQYDIYDINGKNRGTFTGIPNKHTLAKFITESHGSILVKRSHPNSGNFIKNINASQISSLVEKQIDLTIDSLHDENWLEVEKNEIVKICIDEQIPIWQTSLNAAIYSDSCIVLQTPTLIGVESVNVYLPKSDSSYKINLAIGMKYLNFKNEEVLLGYNEYKGKDGIIKKWARNNRDEEDPERIETITGKYLVDKYPVTNCEITQLMWDSIPMSPSFENSRLQNIAEQWMLRKKNSERNKNCISKDTAACTIFLLQAMKYANARSIREGLKPYYKFSTTKEEEQKILSKGLYIIGYFDLSNNADYFIQISVDYTSNGYRLPFYDEWMMLARGGDKKNKAPWGDSSGSFEKTKKYAKFKTKMVSFETEPVGQLTPNGYGLYDMFGLVQEHVLLKSSLFRGNFGFASCLKGGDYHVSLEDGFDDTLSPYWKWINYGYYEPGHPGYGAGFRLIRNIGNNAKWENRIE